MYGSISVGISGRLPCSSSLIVITWIRENMLLLIGQV